MRNRISFLKLLHFGCKFLDSHALMWLGWAESFNLITFFVLLPGCGYVVLLRCTKAIDLEDGQTNLQVTINIFRIIILQWMFNTYNRLFNYFFIRILK
jgi:hypothetical protein